MPILIQGLQYLSQDSALVVASNILYHMTLNMLVAYYHFIASVLLQWFKAKGYAMIAKILDAIISILIWAFISLTTLFALK